MTYIFLSYKLIAGKYILPVCQNQIAKKWAILVGAGRDSTPPFSPGSTAISQLARNNSDPLPQKGEHD